MRTPFPLPIPHPPLLHLLIHPAILLMFYFHFHCRFPSVPPPGSSQLSILGSGLTTRSPRPTSLPSLLGPCPAPTIHSSHPSIVSSPPAASASRTSPSALVFNSPRAVLLPAHNSPPASAPSILSVSAPIQQNTTTTAANVPPAVPPNSTTIHTSVPSVVPQVTTVTTTSPSQSSSTLNSHPVVTRSKSGISKKKALLVTRHPLQLPFHDYYAYSEPSCYTEASKSEAWRAAMSEEFSALECQGTWSLVPPSPTQNIIGNRWVYK